MLLIDVKNGFSLMKNEVNLKYVNGDYPGGSFN